MEGKQPKGGTIFAAMNRAAHLILDGEPKILQDDFALEFCGMKDEDALRATLESLHTKIGQKSTPEFARALLQSYRGYAVMRHRYTEDELSKALERGVSQYVILGAGLDSFAYRRRDLEDKLQVFEVDLPAAQEWKKARLHELNISPPSNLTFVPVDFEKQKLTDELRASGYRLDVPVFFSWLGVTQFLTEASVFQTLHEVASSAPGSDIVFEYVLLESLLDDESRRFVAMFKSFAVQSGEPWLSMFHPVSLAERLKEIGFAEVRDFGPEEANNLYFTGRTDGLSPPALLSIGHLMKASVGKD